MVHQRWQKSERLPWEDRYNPPTAADLRKALSDAQANLFDEARDELLALTGAKERVVWRGACWRWTLEYGPARASQPIAAIIPNPIDLQLALVVEPAFVRSIWDRRMKRTVREGLELAAEPFDTEWGVWTLGSHSLLEELIDLLRDRLAYLESGSI